jgi:hypothetical protein
LIYSAARPAAIADAVISFDLIELPSRNFIRHIVFSFYV